MRARAAAVVLAAVAAAAAGCRSVPDGDAPPTFVRDCPECPALVVVPPGTFQMGSPPEETARPEWTGRVGGNERPVHEVRFAEGFAIGATEVTRGQFAAFIDATGYAIPPGCLDMGGGMKVVNDPLLSWRDPGYETTDDHPVACVSWEDAAAYTRWLAVRTGRDYRLPSEAQWEYGARAGTRTPFFWGDEGPDACLYANTRTAVDQERRTPGEPSREPVFPCDDGADRPAPVGRYRPNAFGLYDTVGNVFEWTADCNHTSYTGAPADGSTWVDPEGCAFRVLRGGSASNGIRQNRVASRGGRPVDGRAPNLGFRVVRSLAGTGTGTGPATRGLGPLPDDGTPAAALFASRCAGCHVDRATFRGVYGTDQAAVERAISAGGANNMSMPAWKGELTPAEISGLAAYLRRSLAWQ